MKKNIQDALMRIIKESLKELSLDTYKEDLYLDVPQDIRFGDLSTNIALRLARHIKDPAPKIAHSLVVKIEEYLEKGNLKKYVQEVKSEGAGFINFYLSDAYFYEALSEVIVKGKQSLRPDIGKKKRVLIEFVSANPTGSLSVAHARQAAVGDILARILAFLNFQVKREYYLNDEGNQIDILGKSVELRLKELNGQKIDFPENYYQGDYIYDIAREVQNKQADKTQNLGEFAADYILKIIKKELDDFGIKFDFWYSQKKLRENGKIQAALDFLKKKGLVYQQDGALWFRSTQFSDDKDRVVVKSDGSYTYLAPDIAYHQGKYKRRFTWLINLWGPDHHGYINRLKAAVEALGHKPDSLAIIIVQLVTIFREGKPLQMSTRRGQYITLREVLDEVGKDASRFFFLMRRTSSHLDFDLEMAKKHTPQNPVYYVQYAHARICSILRNCTREITIKGLNLSALKAKEELVLIRKILQLPSVLNICYQTIDPYMLTVYLQELAETFHKFYDLHRVLGEDKELTRARLALIKATRIVLATGLELLGISRPEQM